MLQNAFPWRPGAAGIYDSAAAARCLVLEGGSARSPARDETDEVFLCCLRDISILLRTGKFPAHPPWFANWAEQSDGHLLLGERA